MRAGSILDPGVFRQFTERTFASDRNLIPGNGGGCPMTIENRRQLENTRAKLQDLEQLYVKTQQDPATSEHVRELTLRSLKKRINQFKEEIARFEARAGSSMLKN